GADVRGEREAERDGHAGSSAGQVAQHECVLLKGGQARIDRDRVPNSTVRPLHCRNRPAENPASDGENRRERRDRRGRGSSVGSLLCVLSAVSAISAISAISAV